MAQKSVLTERAELGSEPFPNDDPRQESWISFLAQARKWLESCVQDGIPEPEWIIRRYGTLAEKALELFVRDRADLESGFRILQILSHHALNAMGTQVTDMMRAELQRHQREWEKLAKARIEATTIPESNWTVSSTDRVADSLLRERFEQLAQHAVEAKMQREFEHRFQAVDAWLGLLQQERPRDRKWKIPLLLTASAEHCSELKIRALKAGNKATAEILGEMETQFRSLARENPNRDLYAIRQGMEGNSETDQAESNVHREETFKSTKNHSRRNTALESKPIRRNQRYAAIDEALRQIAESRPRTQTEVFKMLDQRKIRLPHAEPFLTGRGWMLGFEEDRAAARTWLSKRWTALKLPSFPRGSKK